MQKACLVFAGPTADPGTSMAAVPMKAKSFKPSKRRKAPSPPSLEAEPPTQDPSGASAPMQDISDDPGVLLIMLTTTLIQLGSSLAVTVHQRLQHEAKNMATGNSDGTLAHWLERIQHKGDETCMIHSMAPACCMCKCTQITFSLQF